MNQRSKCCALCNSNEQLVRSHLLPAFLYRILGGARNPVRVNARIAYSTSYQLRRHLLCRACENRFNVGGEKWIAANCARTIAKSPIQLALEAAEPVYTWPAAKVYSAQKTDGLDPTKITYFAASVFWRAAATEWDGLHPLSLGPYEPEFRRFLLGLSDFPLSASLVVTVSNSDETRLAMAAPHGTRKDGYHQFGFFIPGMTFDLFLGGKVPEPIRSRACIVQAPFRPIFLTGLYDHATRNGLVRLLKTAKHVN